MNEALLNQYKTAKEQVDYILMRYPSSRENDFALLWYWLKSFGKLTLPFLPQTIMDQLNGKPETLRTISQPFYCQFICVKDCVGLDACEIAKKIDQKYRET